MGEKTLLVGAVDYQHPAGSKNPPPLQHDPDQLLVGEILQKWEE